MLRPAVAGDERRIEGFLASYAETSMFLRSNLAEFGVEGGDDPRATTFWIGEDSGEINAVFGRSKAGYLMMQVPDRDPTRFDAFRRALAGLKVAGMTGASEQVDLAVERLGLTEAEFALKRPEPLYRLNLDRLIVPDLPGTIRPAREADREMLNRWVWHYDTETLGAPDNQTTRNRVQNTVDRIIQGDATRILEVGGQPVAKTAFNAELPDIVQIGGVYTPIDLRNRGYARLAVALHLVEARNRGVGASILFASGEPACRAYEAIGFQRIGTYSLAMLASPLFLEATA